MPESSPTLPWHAEPPATVARRLGVELAVGLSDAEAAKRLAEQGPNALAQKPPPSRIRQFLSQFANFLVVMLLAAAIVAAFIGDWKDTVVILGVILFNATLGFWQEFRAEATLAALKQMLPQNARVRRNGDVVQVLAVQLVPGDVVLLEAGDRVPADGRVLVAHAAEVAESVLTGESQPIAKTTEALTEPDVQLAERTNCAWMNTVVTRGRLEMLVTATGMATEMGKVSGMLAVPQESQTPLQEQLDGLGKRLTLISLSVIAVLFVVGLLREQPFVQILMTAIALAVAAIPEGLPAVVTVTLAIGMHRMAQKRAIIKKLAAVETLGCVTVICSDKTGTLTQNKMTARAMWANGQRVDVTHGVPEALNANLLAARLCNDATLEAGQLLGDPTEVALLTLAKSVANRPRLAEIPFDAAHKFMATFHADGDHVLLCVKGAPDVVLARVDGEVDAANGANNALAGEAMRVLALAHRQIPVAEFHADADLLPWVQDLTLDALVGLLDPPRTEAKAAIALCAKAGVAVKMITGDHKLTAQAIAAELGLHGEVMTGAELDALTPQQLSPRIDAIAVFARVAPEHKVRIVEALRLRGHVVAMTGDGVNDAPALQRADIGVAMGVTGTQVTQEAATMVLTDDNFATIVSAVHEGRTVYDNIVKFVRFQLSTSLGALLTVAIAPLLGLPTPFTAIQILWINIIMDGPPAMALGIDPARRGLMSEPPRPRDSAILTMRRLLVLLSTGAVMAATTLFAFHHGQTEGQLPYALTLAFTTFVLLQFFNALNARAETQTVFSAHLWKNRALWLALCVVLSLQVLVVHWSVAQRVFGTVDLTLHDWALAVALASVVLWVEEARKKLNGLLPAPPKNRS